MAVTKRDVTDALKALKAVEKDLKRFHPPKKVECETKKIEEFLKKKLKAM